MKNFIIVTCVIVALVLLAIGLPASSYNKAVGLGEQLKESWSSIDVQQKRRVDLLYNLVDCVKEYDKHESETLRAVVAERGKSMSANDVNTMIGAIREAYPQLQSQNNYNRLMTEIAMTENKIASVRDHYNSTLKEYQRYIKKFPTSIFLGMMGYVEEKYEYLKYDAPIDAPQNLFNRNK
ncbi:MAG: LemA family protein [Paludibacteraceae bacterium]|nr:LemA family protein [Paludibacteraceae bacterium]